jgi:hypothetical protein
MGSTLFVAHENVLNATSCFHLVKVIINWQNGSTGITKNILNTVALEAVKESKTAGCALRRYRDGGDAGIGLSVILGLGGTDSGWRSHYQTSENS